MNILKHTVFKAWLPLLILLPLGGCINNFFDELLHNNNLAYADYWREEPMILSAGVGFCDIVAADIEEVNRETAEQSGAAWLDDASCEVAQLTRLTSEGAITFAWKGEADYATLRDGAIGFDGLPIVFSWPVLMKTIDPTDFKFTLNTGETVFPLFAGSSPNWEFNERNCVVVFAEFANRLPSTDPNARFPVRLEIVDDGSPLMLIGPNQQIVSAVGLSWETTTSPYDPNNGPRLVGAKLNYCGERAAGEGVAGLGAADSQLPNDEFALYGGGDFRLRILTTGGFSPDGVRGVKPTEFERFFRIHALGENGDTVLIDQEGVDTPVLGGTLRVVGLSDLGQLQATYDDCYIEDTDNYIDIILVGDEAAARNITFLEIPSLEGGYSPFFNPGGPGSTPFPGVTYTQPGPRDLEPVIICLDDPWRVSYDAARYE